MNKVDKREQSDDLLVFLFYLIKESRISYK